MTHKLHVALFCCVRSFARRENPGHCCATKRWGNWSHVCHRHETIDKLQLLHDGVAVFLPRRLDCVSGKVVPVPRTSGYLASLSTGETGCGATDTAWLIDAGPGQTVVISMLDFAVSRHSAVSSNSTPTTHRHRVYQLVRAGWPKIWLLNF